MQYCQLAFFCILLQYCFISKAYSQVEEQASPKNQLRIISKICLYSPYDCLKNVDDVLDSTPKNSRVYFEILQYKMEALFNLQRGETLYQETKKWINKPDLPLTFQITNAIYYAKSAWNVGKPEERQASYLLAKSLLNQVNNAFPSPLRLVQFANLQMSLKEYEEAYELMTGLLKKYPNSPDIRFMVELHGNLGHAANLMGKTEQSLIHWQETKKWVFIFGNKQQIAVVLFNLADIHEQLAQYKEAKKYFNEAIKFGKEAGDKVKTNQSRYRLLNIRLMTEDLCANEELFSAIEESYLPKKPKYQMSLLVKKLSSC